MIPPPWQDKRALLEYQFHSNQILALARIHNEREAHLLSSLLPFFLVYIAVALAFLLYLSNRYHPVARSKLFLWS